MANFCNELEDSAGQMGRVEGRDTVNCHAWVGCVLCPGQGLKHIFLHSDMIELSSLRFLRPDAVINPC